METKYPSEKVLPYVYFGINRSTGEFYFGYREANKTPSHEDFGGKYRTSSKYVKPQFEKFDWIILAEFFKWEDAYEFEQQLIIENWGNEKLLNKSYHISSSNKKFRCPEKFSQESINKMIKSRTGRKHPPRSEQAKQNMRKPKSEEGRKNIAAAAEIRKQTYIASEETRKKISIKAQGRVQSEETKKKRVDAVKEYNKEHPETVKERIERSVATRKERNVRPWNDGKSWPEEMKKKLRKPKKKSECPHCGLIATKRWHFDNCRKKKND